MTSPFAFARKPELIGEFKDWKASVFDDGKDKVCYILTQPVKKEGKYKRRGEPWFIVRDNSITFIAGYRYRPKCDLSKDQKCQVEVSIDNNKFMFYTHKDQAIAYEDNYKKLIAYLRKGKDLQIIGYSQRGTKTTDTFSLFGFTAAYKKMRSTCK